MGTWAAGSFGNDHALDFVERLTSFVMVTEAVANLAAKGGNLETDEACHALAACDLLAAGLGRPPGDLPDLPDLSLQAVPDDVLRDAREVVTRVSETSELAKLWADAEDEGAEWQAEIEGLLTRLTPSLPYDAPIAGSTPEKPDDFIGYCGICYGMVTERDGVRFEHTDEDGGLSSTLAIYPHRKCIEERVPGPRPYWRDDGSPMPATRRQLMLALGFEDSNLTEDGRLLAQDVS